MEPQEVNLESLTGLVQQMPEVQEHVATAEATRADAEAGISAPPAAPPAAPPEPKEERGKRDKRGTRWNPDIHEAPPRLNRDGRWAGLPGRRKKLAGTKATQTAAGRQAEPLHLPPEQPAAGGGGVSNAPPVPVVDMGATAQAATAAFIGLNLLMFPELRPEPGEAESIETALRGYFELHGAPDIPPWLGLAVVMGTYTGKRALHESSRPRVLKWWDRMKSIFKKRVDMPTQAAPAASALWT